MAETFKPTNEEPKRDDTLGGVLKYKIQKLYGEAFPSIASQALFKLEGLKDAAKQELTDRIGYGFKTPSLDQDQPAVKLDFSGIPTIELNESNVLSYLGTPIFQQVTIKAGNYYVLDNGVAVLKSFPNDLILPATTTVQFGRSKVINKTQISGTSGTVKEMWGFGDWEIILRGLIISEGNNNGRNADVYPSSELSRILEFENIADAVDVSSELLGLLKVKRICIERFGGNQVVGKPNVIPFEMSCTSDEANELIIKNNQLGN